MYGCVYGCVLGERREKESGCGLLWVGRKKGKWEKEEKQYIEI